MKNQKQKPILEKPCISVQRKPGESLEEYRERRLKTMSNEI